MLSKKKSPERSENFYPTYNKGSNMKKQHAISIEQQYYDELKKYADEENKSLTEMAEKVITDFIEKRKKS